MDEPEGLQPMAETLCLDHVTDSALYKHAKQSATEQICSFCTRHPGRDRVPLAVPMDVVAQRVFEAAMTRYRSFDDASYFEGEAYESDIETAEVVYDIAAGAFDDSVSERVLDSITRAIATPQSWFEDDTRDQFAYSWERFAETVRHEARFVLIADPRPGGENEPPARLARFLAGLLGYADKSTRMLHTLPTGTKLYRGRMTDNVAELRAEVEKEPAQKLGAAPPSRAAAGRMSGEGVPLFYGADNVHTAVAEIALHSPYDFALVGEFTTQRPVTILDFTRNPKVPSIFDLAHQDRRLFAEFIDDFVSAITQPVILDGRERVDYLPTQVVTEYLRWVPRRRIDGIAFPSRAKSRGKNVVLFTRLDDDVVTEPPTRDERRNIALTRSIGGSIDPMLAISAQAITEHSVSRSVRVSPH
jgi:RES domain-containing protein